jgi:hypothetical protein
MEHARTCSHSVLTGLQKASVVAQQETENNQAAERTTGKPPSPSGARVSGRQSGDSRGDTASHRLSVE